MTFELPSGLPEGRPWKACECSDPTCDAVFDKDENTICFAGSRALARAIASIPAMVEEIGRLRAQIGDIQTLLDAAIAGLADNERLRALNAEMREALESLMPAAIKDPVWLKAHAILTKSQKATP